MNATGLMLGDWVYNSSKEKCKVHAISNIFDSNIHLDNYDKPNDGCFELAFEVEPIPLTLEILEKNGFKSCIPEYHLETVYAYQDVSKAVADELYALWPYPNGSFYLLLRVNGKDMVRMDVLYVHQLQHALRLCGIEKEIVL